MEGGRGRGRGCDGRGGGGGLGFRGREGRGRGRWQPVTVTHSSCNNRYSQSEEEEQQQQQQQPQQPQNQLFDICPPRPSHSVVLKPPLYNNNRQIRKKQQNPKAPIVLRPGMILLKEYLSLSDQVNIVETCRRLALCSEGGGFYQPEYRDGGHMHLKMMCLGKRWDPNTGHYTDGPMPLPPHFIHLVQNAILHSHPPFPPFSPDICILNFYTRTGRLGLHQDKDESPHSLLKGLPIVSFSIGDSAQFLYGNDRDVDKAHKVLLESGDVLIFGGKSRNVFHGVTSILPSTAPELLLQQTNLRNGRLNLTFRQY